MKLRNIVRASLALAAILFTTPVFATGALENPQNGSFQSGVGLFSGWHCDADVIEILVDDRPAKIAAYGTGRKDTEGVCGDTDNGFGLLWNFNLFGAGTHNVKVLADGVEFGSAQFTVDFLDQNFVRGLFSFVEITIPDLGKEATLIWQDSMQSYVLTDVQDLDYSLEDIFSVVVGDWTGTWQSAWLPDGTIDMTMEVISLGPDLGMTLIPANITLSDTGCSPNAVGATPIMSLDAMISEAVMADGSEVEFEFFAVESMTMAAGTFVFDTGPCEGLDGIFILSEKVQ